MYYCHSVTKTWHAHTVVSVFPGIFQCTCYQYQRDITVDLEEGRVRAR